MDPLDPIRAELEGRYEIGEEIGHGGMAVVYQARDQKHNRSVALKVLRPELAVALGADRFHREIQIEAQLNHPNILALFDSGQAGPFLYYLAPWADGGTLGERLEREEQLSLEDALEITRSIGGALAFAHANGIVHRDVKPDNILLRSGHAMLADFGIAHAIADTDTESLTESGIAVGTPMYMSPEQASATGRVDARSDQYSLACVLFEMLAGDPPFTGRTHQAILARHRMEPPPSLEVVRPDVPSHIGSAVEKALQKVPAARFRTIDDFLAALEPTAPIKSDPVPTRNRWVRRVATTATVAVAAAIVWLVTRPGPVELSFDKVAVFPLATRGLAPRDTGVGVGIAYLIEAALEHAEPLRWIDAGGLLNAAQLSNPETIRAGEAREIAQNLGAAYSLQGVVQGHQDSTTVLLRLYSVEGDSLIRGTSASGPSGTVPLHHLGIDAVKSLLPALIDPTREIDLDVLRDRRAPAIALWMLGERDYRRSKFESARELYERAIEEDSALALAAVKGAQAASWSHDHARGKVLVDLALAQESELPHRYVVFARGLRDYLRDAADSAIVHFEAAQQVDPDWAEPDAALGEVYYHLLPNVASLDSLSHAAFSRALAKDSGFTSPLFHLAEMTVRRGDIDSTNRLLDQFRLANPDARLVRQLALMRDCVDAETPMDWLALGPINAVGMFEAAKSLSAGAGRADCAVGAFKGVLHLPSATEGERWGAFLGLQGLLVAQGDNEGARQLVDSVVAAGKGVAQTLYILNTVAGAEMSEPADGLDRWARGRFGEGYETLTGTEALWALTVWHQHLGNSDRVRILAGALEARVRQTESSRDSMFAAAADARSVWAQRDTARAIELLSRLGPPKDGADLSWRFGDALPPERLLLAQLLLATGQYRESLRVASVFDHPQPIMFIPYVPASLVVRHEAALALGENALAEEYRKRLIDLKRHDLVSKLDN